MAIEMKTYGEGIESPFNEILEKRAQAVADAIVEDGAEDTFTFGEMREARNKSARGEPLTNKERELAEARRKAEGWGAIQIYILDAPDTHQE